MPSTRLPKASGSNEVSPGSQIFLLEKKKTKHNLYITVASQPVVMAISAHSHNMTLWNTHTVFHDQV